MIDRASLLKVPDRRQHPTGDQPRQAHREQERDGSNPSRNTHGRVYRGTLAVNEQRSDEHIPRGPRTDCNVTGSATTRTVPADVWIVENVRRVTVAHRLTNWRSDSSLRIGALGLCPITRPSETATNSWV